MCCLPVLEARSLRSRCQEGWFLLEAVKSIYPGLFQLRVVCWQPLAFLTDGTFTSSLCAALSLHVAFFIRTPVTLDWGPLLFQGDLILTVSAMSLFQKKKKGHILRSWWLGLQYANLKGHNSTRHTECEHWLLGSVAGGA